MWALIALLRKQNSSYLDQIHDALPNQEVSQYVIFLAVFVTHFHKRAVSTPLPQS